MDVKLKKVINYILEKQVKILLEILFFVDFKIKYIDFYFGSVFYKYAPEIEERIRKVLEK